MKRILTVGRFVQRLGTRAESDNVVDNSGIGQTGRRRVTVLRAAMHRTGGVNQPL